MVYRFILADVFDIIQGMYTVIPRWHYHSYYNSEEILINTGVLGLRLLETEVLRALQVNDDKFLQKMCS